jgi:4-hydroxy-tetrahydrodipicolinate synthase
LHDAWRAGDYATVFALRDRLAPLHDSLFCETNPAPVKYAAKLLGKCDGSLRLPLVEIAEPSRRKVEVALQGVGLI